MTNCHVSGSSHMTKLTSLGLPVVTLPSTYLTNPKHASNISATIHRTDGRMSRLRRLLGPFFVCLKLLSCNPEVDWEFLTKFEKSSDFRFVPAKKRRIFKWILWLILGFIPFLGTLTFCPVVQNGIKRNAPQKYNSVSTDIPTCETCVSCICTSSGFELWLHTADPTAVTK
jgi:hypothetical protein